MKRIFILILSISIVGSIISCGDDDGGDGADFLAQFVGTWEATSITSAGCNDPDENGTFTCDPYCFRLTITSDGKYTLVEADGQTTETGTITVTETTLTICETGETNCDDSDPYTFSGSNTFSVSFTDDESPGCTFTVTFNKQ